MTPNEVRAAATELSTLHQRFAPLFGYAPAQDHALTYLRGLLLHEGRKNVEAIALRFGDGQVRPLQAFLAASPWDYRPIQQEIQAVFAQSLVPSTSGWSVGTVGVFDESSHPKKGKHSVGVARQWCGRLGKKDNCQVGVYLVGVTPAGCALLDHQLYLTEDWVLDKERRRATGVPRCITFRTKPEIALDLHARVQAAGHITLDWLTFDEGYGRDGDFLTGLEKRHQLYVGEVPISTTVWTEDPSTQVPEYTGRGRRPLRPGRDSVRAGGVRVRGGAGVGDAEPEAGAADLAAAAPVGGGRSRGEVLCVQRRVRDPPGGVGVGQWLPGACGGILRGQQGVSGDGTV
jgi:SRSO17 transposase